MQCALRYSLAVLILVALFAASFTTAAEAGICVQICPEPGPNPNCHGVNLTVEVTCGATSCTVSAEVSGNGGSKQESYTHAPGSTTTHSICVGPKGGPYCCVGFGPVSGCDWKAISSDCNCLFIECQ